MFRQRLKGGHRVGAPGSVPQTQHGQQHPPHQMVGWGGQQQQYSNPARPPGPPPTQLGQSVPPPQQQPGEGTAWGWGTENSDGAWNWGDSGNDAWSWNGGQQTAANHQQQLSQHQQPAQQYVQHHGYSQQLQHTSQQQQCPKSSQNVVYSNQHVATSTSSVYQQNPTNAQQYLNGNNPSGGPEEWGGDNWDNDWESYEPTNNNNNTKPANYAKQENQQKQYYQGNQHHHQQHQEYQHHNQYQDLQQQQILQQHNAYQQHQQHPHYGHQYHQQQHHHHQQQQQQQEQQQQQHHHPQSQKLAQQQQEIEPQQHYNQENQQQTYMGNEAHLIHQEKEKLHHEQLQQQQQHEQHLQQQEQHLQQKQEHEQHLQQQQQHEQHQQQQQHEQHQQQQQHDQDLQQQQQQQHDQHLQQQQQHDQHLQQQQQHDQHLQQQQQHDQHLQQQQQHDQHLQQQQQHDQHLQQQQQHDQHLQQQQNEQHLQKQQHEHLQQHQEHQQIQQYPEQQTDEDWGWGNDDWQTTENTEQQQEVNHQQSANYQSESYNQEMQVSTSEQNAPTAFEGFVENGFPQQVGSGDAAGDGWPEQDIDRPDSANRWQQHVPQSSEEQVTSTLHEDPRPPSHHSYQEQENLQQQQQSNDGWKHEEPQVSQGAEDVGVEVAPNPSSLLPKDNTLATDPNVLHVKQDSWGWESNDSNTGSNDGVTQAQPVVPENAQLGYESYNQQYGTHQNMPQMGSESVPTFSVPGSHPIMSSVPVNQSSTTSAVTNWDDGFGDGWEAETPAAEQGKVTEEPHANQVHMEDNLSHPKTLNSQHEEPLYQPDVNSATTEPKQEAVSSYQEKSESMVQPEQQHSVNDFNLHSQNQDYYGNMHQIPVTSSAGWDDGLEQNFGAGYPADDLQQVPGANEKVLGIDDMATLSEAVSEMSIKEDMQEVKEELVALSRPEQKEPPPQEHAKSHPVHEVYPEKSSIEQPVIEEPVTSDQTHSQELNYYYQHEPQNSNQTQHQQEPNTWPEHQHEEIHSGLELQNQQYPQGSHPLAFQQPPVVQDFHSGYPQEYPLNHNIHYPQETPRDPEPFYPQEVQDNSLQPNQSYSHHQQQHAIQEASASGYPEVPMTSDPVLMRIPDGASSVSEVPSGMSLSVDADSNTPHSSGELPTAPVWTNSESFDRPPSTQSAQSTHSAHSSAIDPSVPMSHPQRPPSSHASIERPMSNQSAQSVHSMSSTHSNRAPHPMHVSQEIPFEENQEMLTSDTSAQMNPPEPSFDTKPVTSDVAQDSPELPVSQGLDPTAPPKGNVMGPPPVSGPFGAVPNLRARKGSPFQPPNMKRGIGVPVVAPPQSIPTSQPPVVNPVPIQPTAPPSTESPPDSSETPSVTESSGIPLWSNTENMAMNVKLAVAAPVVPESVPNQQPAVPSNSIPLVVPGLVKEEMAETESPSAQSNFEQPSWAPPEPPAAHNAHFQTPTVKPKVQSLANMPANPSSPAVLDLSRPSRSGSEPRGDGSQGKNETPNFSRMVPGESSKDASSAAAPSYQAPVVVPSMPSERVVTGNDDPQPVPPVRIKQEPSEVRSPPDGPDTSDLLSQGASVVPPVRSETIGSEEPSARNFTSNNSGSRPDLTSDHRNERSGRWERDHSRDRDSRSSDRYRDRSHERGRDYYRDDSPHSRRSYDRDYDRKYDDDRRWRRRDSDEEEDDRRYYESRDRRDRAYRDELDRYSDRPVKEEKDRGHRESRDSREKRRGYRDRSKDYYHSYDDDPYYGRSDRSQPVSRSSSINNLDNDGDRSLHRSRHDYYDRHDRKDSRSRDSDPRDREGLYSRDARDRDSSYHRDGRDVRDPRRDPRYYGHRGYDDPYASRDLYEQYQYYYQYYRDNPYYKEYYRQWMKQYGQAYASESFLDERNSIHSGRSSINDELKKSISSQFIQDFHGRSSTGVYEPSTIYPEGSFSQLKSYASGELSGVPSVTDDTASEAPQRMTPVQFGRPHISASFTHGGQLLMVLPKDPRDGEKAVVQLRDMQKMLCQDPIIKEAVQQMKNYPGPLTLADTHKEVVVKYCEQQVADATSNPGLTDRESVVLIWEYLALLVKQNGKLLGSDVASLLLKGREVNSQSQNITPNTTPDEAPNTPASDSSPQDEGIDMHSQSAPPVARDEALLLKKFTEYLCLGRKREAVDYAMREELWGHALALSYKMDNNTHTRVLAAFSNSIPRTNVLLTLFQQLSGKRPEIAKSYSAQQWGDWRQHLAMMVSNPSGNTQRDKASIVTLGDTLATKGQLHAAHFCYLVADAEWGTFSSKSSQLVLIGSSHHQSFNAFATNEAIQCTEVYEFARSLDSSNPALETFQSYKLIYALRLTEYGFPAEALRYCEVISQHLSKTSVTYPADFLSQVYDLASRLKYHDLHYQMCEGELLEMPDPEWLGNLQQLMDAARHREQMTNEEVKDNYTDPNFNQGVPHADYYHQTHPEAKQQMNAEHGTYHQEVSAEGYHQPTYHMDSVDGQNPLPVDQPSISHPDGVEMPSLSGEVPQVADGMSQSQENAAPPIPMMQPDRSYSSYDNSYWSGYQQTPFPPSEAPNEMHSLPPTSDVNGEHLSTGITSYSQPNSLSGYPGYQQPPYPQWDQQPHATPTISPEPEEPQPTPSPQVPHEEEWNDMSGKESASSTTDATSDQKTDSKSGNKEEEKDKSQEKNSSWSITSIFGWKKSKQAILPDDKNPSIVWDEAKKRWVNQDGEEEVAAPPPPPPKSPMSTAGGPPPPMKLRGMKKSRYVNTEKDKLQPGAPAMNPMMPPMLPNPSGGPVNPAGPMMTPQFMVPDPSAAPETTSTQPQVEPQQPLPQQQQQQQPQQAPQPALPLPPEVTQGMSSDGDENVGAVPMMAPPSMQPQFFNPAQFTPAPSHPARRPGPSRRAYPTKR